MPDGSEPVRVRTLARRAPSVFPDAPLAVVLETLRVSPYGCVAVVEPVDGFLSGRLVGIVSARSVSETLLALPESERESLRKTGTARHVLAPITADDCAVASDTTGDLSLLLNRVGKDAVPVVESRDGDPFYLGMVGRSDVLRDLVRPFTPPQLGGMATPLGVYLTDGNVSGGVGTLALAATGLLTFVLHAAGLAILSGASYLAARYIPGFTTSAESLPPWLQGSAPETVWLVAQMTLFLLLMRQTPLAGYHAAEHQTVHAIERGEPLLPDVVRTMPRVHPRCSTNLVAGLLLFYVVGTALVDALPAGGSYLVGAVTAFALWRRFGAFLQTHFTTRPATGEQIESGIRAAQELFAARDSSVSVSTPRRVTSPVRTRFGRVWSAGFVQIFLGSAVGMGLVALLGWLYPPLWGVFGE